MKETVDLSLLGFMIINESDWNKEINIEDED